MNREECLKIVSVASENGVRPNLSGADLTGADLSRVNLTGADLTGANLSKADLDFSSLPLWCGGTMIKLDRHIGLQLLYHAVNQDHQNQEILDAIAPIRALADKFRTEFRGDAPTCLLEPK